jgi:hypothetical protein
MLALAQWVWYASLVLYALLAWKILSSRLPYRALAVYAIASVVQGPILLLFPVRSMSYARAWMGTESVIMVLEVWLVLEILQLLKASYPGIGKYGSRVVALCCLGAVTASAGSVLFDLQVIQWGKFFAQTIFLLERITATILALSLFAIQWFIARLGKRGLTANLRRHIRISSFFLSILAAGYFLASVGHYLNLASVSGGIAALGCQLLWIAMLRRSGEARPVLATTGEDVETAFAALEQKAQEANDYLAGAAPK